MDKISNVTAVVLCGGLGTRLRSIAKNIPKSMVDVAGRPFLEYLLDYLISQGINKAVLAVSYCKEVIISHFGNRYRSLDISYSIESEPLGTGGAIRQAIESISTSDNPSDYVLILNGDTYTEYQLYEMLKLAENPNTTLVMAIKAMTNTARYGQVRINASNQITAFLEKKDNSSGLINLGVYLFPRRLASQLPSLKKFSFEIDYLEPQTSKLLQKGILVQGYFIDIGTPEDYRRAYSDFQKSYHS